MDVDGSKLTGSEVNRGCDVTTPVSFLHHHRGAHTGNKVLYRLAIVTHLLPTYLRSLLGLRDRRDTHQRSYRSSLGQLRCMRLRNKHERRRTAEPAGDPGDDLRTRSVEQRWVKRGGMLGLELDVQRQSEGLHDSMLTNKRNHKGLAVGAADMDVYGQALRPSHKKHGCLVDPWPEELMYSTNHGFISGHLGCAFTGNGLSLILLTTSVFRSL
ncbi:hypothetical protein ARMSODRAFT_1024853 [Armillaria solidipes]|uniref:Uncharacterized protein n=1 Tax=Armillaria solidipes TaxID=1076256 RepID=A0A2H3B8Q6_9AGAR|nr:hypothetical protein ARMSODRAFT_1024853 [Armillaria solidipes]